MGIDANENYEEDIVCDGCGAVQNADGFTDRCNACDRVLDPILCRQIEATRKIKRHIASQKHLPALLKNRLFLEVNNSLEFLKERALRHEAMHAISKTPPKSPRHPSPETSNTTPLETLEATPKQDALVEFEESPSALEPLKVAWRKLSPIIAENLLLTLAVFLIVSGAVFFLTTAWTTMSGPARLWAIFLGLESFGALLFFGGRFLNRTHEFDEVERALIFTAGFLIPIQAIAARLLIGSSPGFGWIAGLIVVATTLHVYTVSSRILGLGPPSRLVAPVLVFILGILGTSLVSGFSSICAILAAMILYVSSKSNAIEWAKTAGSRALTGLSLGMIAVAASAFSLNLGREMDGSWPSRIVPLGLLFTSAALWFRRGSDPLITQDERRESWDIMAIALSLIGIVMSAGNQSALLAGCGAGTLIGIGIAFPSSPTRKGSSLSYLKLVLLLGLVLSAITWFLLPAPIKEAALALRDKASEALGYGGGKLPLSFYGLAFFPYLAILLVVAQKIRVHPRVSAWQTSILVAWTQTLSVGLAALSVFAGSDNRAPAAVLLALGALWLGAGFVRRNAKEASAGLLGLIASAAFGLHFLNYSLERGLMVIATLGLITIALGCALKWSKDSAKASLSSAFFDASALAAFGCVCTIVTQPERFINSWDWEGGPAFALTALWLSSLGVLYRQGILSVIASLFAMWSLPRIVAWIDGTPESPWEWHAPEMAILFAAMSALPLVSRHLSRTIQARRFENKKDSYSPLFSAASLLILQLPICFSTIIQWTSLETTIPSIVATLAAATIAWTAVWRWRFPWIAPVGALAVIGFCGHILLWFNAWAIPESLPKLGFPPHSLLVFSSIGLSALIFAMIRRIATSQSIQSPAVSLSFVSGVIALFGWMLFRISYLDHTPPRPQSWIFLSSMTATLMGACLLAGKSRAPFAMLAFVTLPVCVVSVFDGLGLSFYSQNSAWIVAAVLVWILSRLQNELTHRLERVTAIYLSVALFHGVLLNIDSSLIHQTDLGFIVAPIAARLLLSQRKWARALLIFFSLGCASYFLGVNRLAESPLDWLPAFVVTFTGIGCLLARVPLMGIRPCDLTLMSRLVGIIAMGFLAANALSICVSELPLFLGYARLSLEGFALGTAFLVLVSPAQSFDRHFAKLEKSHVAWLAFALAIIPIAPLASLFNSSNTESWITRLFLRPDIDMAALGLLAAWSIRKPKDAFIVGYALSSLALLLSTFKLGVSPPYALSAVALIPLICLRRHRNAFHADLLGYGLIATIQAWTLEALRVRGSDPIESALLFGAVMASSFILVRAIAKFASKNSGELATAIALRFRGVGTLSLVGSLVWFSVDSIIHGNLIATPKEICLASLIGATAMAFSWRRHRFRPDSMAVFLGVIAMVLTYVFFWQRTTWLSALDGHHDQALMVIGGCLVAGEGVRKSAWRSPLSIGGFLLTVPALARALAHFDIHASGTYFLLSALFVFAGLKWSLRVFQALALASVNLALFCIWTDRGMLDPAFYGVPAGLSLLLAVELNSGILSPRTRVGISIIGWASLLGSIGAQVLRVDDPTHAFALFAVGIIAVLFGWKKRRFDYQIAGTAAVVLDVIAYLLRHGFERDFIGAGLLVGAGITLLSVAGASAKRRRGEGTTR